MAHIVTATMIVAKTGNTEQYFDRGVVLPEIVDAKERQRLLKAGLIAVVKTSAPVSDAAKAKADAAATAKVNADVAAMAKADKDAKAAAEKEAAAKAAAEAKEAADKKAAK